MIMVQNQGIPVHPEKLILPSKKIMILPMNSHRWPWVAGKSHVKSTISAPKIHQNPMARGPVSTLRRRRGASIGGETALEASGTYRGDPAETHGKSIGKWPCFMGFMGFMAW